MFVGHPRVSPLFCANAISGHFTQPTTPDYRPCPLGYSPMLMFLPTRSMQSMFGASKRLLYLLEIVVSPSPI